MRILSLRIIPVARILAIVYGAMSPFLIIGMLLSKAQYIRIPLGVVAPLLYLNINFDLEHPTTFVGGALMIVFGAACYGITGWLTGTFAVLCFNFVAGRMGGVEATSISKNFVPSEKNLPSVGVS